LQALKRWEQWAKIPVMTFPIKKRINTELLIDRNQGLYIQKGDKETDQEKYLDKGMDQENIWPLRRGWNWNSQKIKCGNENKAGIEADTTIY